MAEDRRCQVAPDFHHYKYCPHCGKYNPYETWKLCFCSLNCKEIFEVCLAFNSKRITAEEAMERLDKCDLSDEEHFHKMIKDDLFNIRLACERKETTIEVNEVVEKPIEIKEESIQAKPKKHRRRKKFSE